MMSELIPYLGGGAVGRDGRQVSRQMTRGRLVTQLCTAALDNVTDVALAKVENLTMATGSAMQQVARVAQAQRQLEQMVPEASGRLAFLADDHAMGCAEVLSGLRRDMGRIR